MSDPRTADVLLRLCDRRRADVEAAKAQRPLLELKAAASERPPSNSLTKAIEEKRRQGRRAILAEIKRASPSAGTIRAEVDAAGRAQRYARGGAVGMSVLTEPHEFLGRDEDLTAARAAVPSLPLLRKDFTVDFYQIWESRVLGADVVLLLVNILGERTRMFVDEAREAGVEALVEVHDAEELAIAAESGATLIGVNARNLRTFETKLEWVEELIDDVPESAVAVAESGIAGLSDIERLEAAGAQAYLVGETLMRASDPVALLQAWGA